MVHMLKTLPNYFEAVRCGNKTFEIRKNDRNFQIGDTLVLQEYLDTQNTQSIGGFTGREISRRITYITDFEQQPGYVVMAIQ